MINSYTFKKRIINNCDTYYLEIIFPDSFNDFIYKIYGDKGFIQHGKHNLYNNILKKNVLIIEIDKLQLIFISIIFSNKNDELFDFVNLHDLLDVKKNIKINIKKINSDNNIFNNLKIHEEDSDKEDSDEEDSDEEDSDEEDKEEDSDEDDKEEDSDEDNKEEDSDINFIKIK